MKTLQIQQTRQYLSKLRRSKRRLVRNWWVWLAVLLVAIVCIAIFQKRVSHHATSLTGKTSISAEASNSATNYRPYGIALGGTISGLTGNKRAAVLAQIKTAGFSEVRLSLSWVDAEPTPGKFNWSTDDSLMQAIKKSGLRPILLVDRAPAWARSTACRSSTLCAPQNDSDYATFVGMAASRYASDDVAAWEIWNEENSSNFWKPLPDPSQYAQLLIAANASIKKADPAATVLVGGLSGDSVDKVGPSLIDPRTFLTKIYAAGAYGNFDGVGYHPYIAGIGLPTKASDYNGWAKMDADDSTVRSIMVANGDQAKSIWITEFGIPTGGTGAQVTYPANPPAGSDHASQQAEVQIVQALIADMQDKPWIKDFHWFTYKDDTTATSFSGAAYGIWQLNGKPKPVLQVLQQAEQTKVSLQ